MAADLEARVAELERDLEAMTYVLLAMLFGSHATPLALLAMLDRMAPGTRAKTAEFVQSPTVILSTQEAVLKMIDHLIVANPDSPFLRRLRAQAEAQVRLEPGGEH